MRSGAAPWAPPRGTAFAALAVVGLLAACADDNPLRAGELDDVADSGMDARAGEDTRDDSGDASDGGIDVSADANDASRDATEPADVPVPSEGAFVSTPTAWVEAGTSYVYAFETDPPSLQVTLLSGPDEASLAEGVLTWEAPALGVDAAAFELAALAGDTQVASQAFEIRVDHAPELLNSPNPVATLGQAWTFAPNPFDADGDPLVVSLLEGPEWLTLETSDESAVLSGTPDIAGEQRFTLRVSSAELVREFPFDIRVVEPIRDLRAEQGLLLTSGGELRIVGCCFDLTPRVFWGAIEASEVVRVNAAALDVRFGPLPTGQQQITLVEGERETGALDTPILALPRVEERLDGLAVLGAFDTESEVRVIDVLSGYPLIASPRAIEGGVLVPWPAGGGAVVRIEVDSVGGAPVVWGVPADVLVIEVDPPIHAPGSTVALGLSASATDLTLSWEGGSAACISLGDPLRCIATVPLGASGPLRVSAPSGPLPRVVAAGAPARALTPELVGANRTTLPIGVETLVWLEGLGFDAASAALEARDAEARLLWRSPVGAVAAVRASAVAPELRLTVGARSSSWLRFETVVD